MSQKAAKRMRRMVNKAVSRTAADLYQDLNEMPLRGRLKAAGLLLIRRMR